MKYRMICTIQSGISSLSAKWWYIFSWRSARSWVYTTSPTGIKKIKNSLQENKNKCIMIHDTPHVFFLGNLKGKVRNQSCKRKDSSRTELSCLVAFMQAFSRSCLEKAMLAWSNTLPHVEAIAQPQSDLATHNNPTGTTHRVRKKPSYRCVSHLLLIFNQIAPCQIMMKRKMWKRRSQLIP